MCSELTSVTFRAVPSQAQAWDDAGGTERRTRGGGGWVGEHWLMF